jgi:deoxyribodipyrimidine photo-lyase
MNSDRAPLPQRQRKSRERKVQTILDDVVVLWFRNDLRVHDNELLAYPEIGRPLARVVAVFCLDPRYFGDTGDSEPAGNFEQHWQDIDTGGWLADAGLSSAGASCARSRCGPQRSRFLAESLVELQRTLLTNFGIPLLIKKGSPQDVISSVVDTIVTEKLEESNHSIAVRVFFQGEDTSEEIQTEHEVRAKLEWSCSETQSMILDRGRELVVDIRAHYQHTLYHRADIKKTMRFDIVNETLPFPFGKFFHETCKMVAIRHEVVALTVATDVLASRREWVATSSALQPPSVCRVAQIVKAMGYSSTQRDLQWLHRDETVDTSVHGAEPFSWCGGESNALQHLTEYMAKGLWNYHHTRNQLENKDGKDMSSKLSPWLANGCLSVRRVYWEMKQAETTKPPTRQGGFDHVAKYWFELCWRDFFRFYCAFFKQKVFFRGGPSAVDAKSTDIRTPWLNPWNQCGAKTENDRASLKKVVRCWICGSTSQPLVDALMRELLSTGYMGNRGRYIVASFLTHYLGVDWRIGASWFEYILLDHDVCSNYGEWSSMAGVARHPQMPTPLGIKGRGPSAGGRGKGGDKAGAPWAQGAGGDGFSVFDPDQQAHQYDRHGDYVAKWERRPSTTETDGAPELRAEGTFKAFSFQANIAAVLGQDQTQTRCFFAPAGQEDPVAAAAPGSLQSKGSSDRGAGVKKRSGRSGGRSHRRLQSGVFGAD